MISFLSPTRHTAPSSPHLTVERIGSAVFNITISLAYTGGGNITQFILEVRSKENPTAGWRSLGAFEAVPTGNILEWRVIAMHDQYLSEQGLEFRIAIMNTRGHVSEPSLHLEPYGESVHVLYLTKLMIYILVDPLLCAIQS